MWSLVAMKHGKQHEMKIMLLHAPHKSAKRWGHRKALRRRIGKMRAATSKHPLENPHLKPPFQLDPAILLYPPSRLNSI